MTKVKFLILIIVVLFISNCIMIGLHFKADNRRKEGPKRYIIEKLHFNEAQTEKYLALIPDHRNAMREKERTMDQLRNELYASTQNPTDSIKINQIYASIALNQIEAEKINFKHFLAIKALCNPSQMGYYNELTKEIAGLFSMKRPKNKDQHKN
jgi:hypothetical protein